MGFLPPAPTRTGSVHVPQLIYRFGSAEDSSRECFVAHSVEEQYEVTPMVEGRKDCWPPKAGQRSCNC